ncbi:Lrp/AsnC family transcriptional regulator [Sphingobium boeckii]|uniref:Lrp/AsnC family leucine-responsive transcriptional regulator n=1 Tax=Sphingobium boeckii TaxID=1082345 RepID=A0A7W9AG34_9SPHN|nr:Lrp/AsnC family transcriptional regulator [Sphingobium boeckii]MBB5685030.1 Lrp/AsnC family leucine-responsive transcriptional regulator [Sphingobium boeckii]
MNVLDQKILKSIESNGRQSFQELGSDIGLSKTACWARVQSLEKNGVILGYGAKLDPRSLGLGVFAIIQIMIDPSMRKAFETAVQANPAILECHTIAGEADYVMKVACRDVDDLDNLLRMHISLLPGLQRSTTMICMNTIKAGGALTAAIEPRDTIR